MSGHATTVVLHGVFPPPWGGVSVHLQRLGEFLAGQGLRVRRADMKRGSWDRVPGYRRWLLPAIHSVPAGRALFHHHVSSFSDLADGARFPSLGRGPRLATLHNLRMLDPWNDPLPSHRDELVRGRIFDGLDAVVVVNDRMREPLRRLGVPDERIHHIPAFLPPRRNPEARSRLVGRFPFLADGGPVVTATASSPEEYQGVPLYGWDLMLRLTAELAQAHPSLHVLFVQTKTGNEAWRARFHDERLRLGVESRFHLSEEPCDFPELVSMSSVFVRPTNTDGDALSVREALFLGTPTVASDCVPRPQGTRLFRTRDHLDLARAVDEALRGSPPPGSPDLRDYGQTLLELYMSLGLGSPGPATWT